MPYVYFIQDTGTGVIKIGWATDVERRIYGLQISAPSPLVLLAAIKGTHKTERSLHDRFADTRTFGEWFQPTPELLAYIETAKTEGVDIATLLPRRQPKTHCRHGHELTAANLMADGNCRECAKRRR